MPGFPITYDLKTNKDKKAHELCHAIAGELDGRTWTPDTLNAIADLLRNAGFTIREWPEDIELCLHNNKIGECGECLAEVS